MYLAKIENGVPTAVGYFSELFPNVSFQAGGPTQEWMTENSVMPVVQWKDHDALTEKIEECAPYIEGDSVYTVQVVPMTEQEIESATARLAAQVRGQRARLLFESDWTQLTDAPVNSAAWATYRQALRNVPEQAGFPTNVEWPVAPE